MKIKTKLVLLFTMFILVFALFTGIIFYSYSKDIMKEQVHNSLEGIAESRARHIETMLKGYEETTIMVSTGNAFKDILDESKNYSKQLEEVNRRINSIIQTNEEISRIRVLDKNGIIIASSHEDVGIDKSNHEIFLNAKEHVNVGDLHVSNFTGNAVMSISAPILLNEKFAGVIVINFNADELYKITTNELSIGETGEIYLINKESYMITPSKFINNTFLKQKIDTINSRNCLEHHSISEGYNKFHSPEIFKNYRGKDVLGVHVYLSEIHWCLLAEVDEKEAFLPMSRIKNIIILVFTIMVILGVFVTLFFSESLTKQIIRLRDAAEKISKGSLNIKIKSKSKDEIGQLANSFNKMTLELKKSKAELEKYSKNLEEQVKSRTKELQSKVYELEKFNKLTIGREMRMVELKKRIKELEAKLKK